MRRCVACMWERYLAAGEAVMGTSRVDVDGGMRLDVGKSEF